MMSILAVFGEGSALVAQQQSLEQIARIAVEDVRGVACATKYALDIEIQCSLTLCQSIAKLLNAHS